MSNGSTVNSNGGIVIAVEELERKIVELRNEFLNSRKEVQKLKLDAAEVETHAKQTTNQVD